jgi:hypothetical protein
VTALSVHDELIDIIIIELLGLSFSFAFAEYKKDLQNTACHKEKQDNLIIGIS